MLVQLRPSLCDAPATATSGARDELAVHRMYDSYGHCCGDYVSGWDPSATSAQQMLSPQSETLHSRSRHPGTNFASPISAMQSLSLTCDPTQQDADSRELTAAKRHQLGRKGPMTKTTLKAIDAKYCCDDNGRRPCYTFFGCYLGLLPPTSLGCEDGDFCAFHHDVHLTHLSKSTCRRCKAL